MGSSFSKKETHIFTDNRDQKVAAQDDGIAIGAQGVGNFSSGGERGSISLSGVSGSQIASLNNEQGFNSGIIASNSTINQHQSLDDNTLDYLKTERDSIDSAFTRQTDHFSGMIEDFFTYAQGVPIQPTGSLAIAGRSPLLLLSIAAFLFFIFRGRK